jgi:chemotaxis protein MotB
MADQEEGDDKSKQRPIIIKRYKKIAAGHHGGSWKVAYADFVTAMMAFFLLMWLLNITSAAQKQGIANYFSPLTLPNPPSSDSVDTDSGNISFFQETEDEIEQDNPEVKGPDDNKIESSVMIDGRKQNIVAKIPLNREKLSEKKSPAFAQSIESKIKENENTDNVRRIAPEKTDYKPIETTPINAPKTNVDSKMDKPIQLKEQRETQKDPKDPKKDVLKDSLKDSKKDPKELKSQEKMDAKGDAKIEAKVSVKIDAKIEAQSMSKDPKKDNLNSYEEERKKFDSLAQSLKQAIREIPELKELEKNLRIDVTDEGLRIQIVDELKKPMFASGSSIMFDYTNKLIASVGKSISGFKNRISISGHTDSIPFRTRDGYSNWELSSDRAQATRKVIVGNGVDPKRIVSVVGKESTEPLMPDTPDSPQNRRISLTLLFDKKSPAKQEVTPQNTPEIKPVTKEEVKAAKLPIPEVPKREAIIPPAPQETTTPATPTFVAPAIKPFVEEKSPPTASNPFNVPAVNADNPAPTDTPSVNEKESAIEILNLEGEILKASPPA